MGSRSSSSPVPWAVAGGCCRGGRKFGGLAQARAPNAHSAGEPRSRGTLPGASRSVASWRPSRCRSRWGVLAPEQRERRLTPSRTDCRRRRSNWSRRLRVVAERGDGPLLATGGRQRQVLTVDHLEAAICTPSEPKCSHCQSTSDDHLDGPSLGAEQPEHHCRSGRRYFRRLIGTAADELTRTAIKAISSGGLLFLTYWWNRH